MTKYILNSGAVKKDAVLAKKFFAEVVKDLGTSPRILICYFAQPREDWESKFIDDLNALPKLFPEYVVPTFQMAMPDMFAEQITNSDAIFIHGGDDHLVQYWLRKFDLPKIWGGKVVATSSASSNALSKYFWTCDWRKNMEGLGILPIKFLSHFESSYGAEDSRGPVDWQLGLSELKNFNAELPVYALKEGEFVIMEMP